MSQGVNILQNDHNGVERDVSFDRPLITESSNHARIEAGDTFIHNGMHVMASGATLYHLLRVGANPFHLTKWDISSDAAPIEMEFSEAPTMLTLGTVGAIVNKNRESPNTPTILMYEGGTISAIGVHLEGDIKSGAFKGGASGGLDSEWMLKRNTDYLFRLKNNDVGSANVSFHAEGYEETHHA